MRCDRALLFKCLAKILIEAIDDFHLNFKIDLVNYFTERDEFLYNLFRIVLAMINIR